MRSIRKRNRRVENKRSKNNVDLMNTQQENEGGAVPVQELLDEKK